MNFNLYNYEHIIWDWNGTLFNDVELCANTMNFLLEQESHPTISIDKYKSVFTFPVVEYYKIAGHTFAKNSFEVLGKQFMDEYERNKLKCELYPAAKKLLDELSNENFTQHLLSAYEQKSLTKIVEHFSIKKYFKYIVGLDNIYASGKMNLGKKLLSLIRQNGKDENILLIGDTTHDFEVAQELGIYCVLVSHGHQDKARLLKHGVLVFDSFKELRTTTQVK
ncbi:MAG: HAD family hydrolase [Ignavibacteriaceae bacterium]|nr:HAD family hydrolase [Ignavibacteriaceae bacterium]